MNEDVLDLRDLIYCHAKMPREGYDKGMIKIEGRIFHRGNTLDYFPNVRTFPTLNEAITSTEDEETFVVAFPFNDTAQMFWFSEEQEENGLVNLLDIWKQCYSKYPRAIWKNKESF